MCLPIDCWLCTPRTDDDHYHAPATKHAAPPPVPAGRGLQPAQRNGNGTSYYPTHGPADRKATNDVRRGPAHHAVPTVAGAARGWHGQAATGAQEKQAEVALKPQPVVARNDKVAAADGARGVVVHGSYYYYHEREQQPAHREDAADSYYPAATATADHERY